MRKTAPDFQHPGAAYAVRDDGTWDIYGFAEVRQILRSTAVQQAGFAAEAVLAQGSSNLLHNPPILYLEGEPHHKARRETNRFFTPSVTDEAYRDFMNQYADDLIAQLTHDKRTDLSDLSMKMAVQVAAQIVGLTDSWRPNSMVTRMENMLHVGNDMLVDDITLWNSLRSQWSTLLFFVLDVWPAIRARRNTPQDDVISYLIDQDYSNVEIMTECLVYGVAGMATTREFIAVALWHLFEDPHLMERMREGGKEERYAILHEILRLEPVVSHLYRRTTDDLTFESNGETVSVPAGTKLTLHIIAANSDARAMGESPDALCPMRDRADMRPKVPEHGLSFGDGSHRCPGAYVAIQETDIFLQKLLAVPGLTIESTPDISHSKVAESYEIRNFILRVEAT